MLLSSDELEILDYLKTWNGAYVSMVEICRRAGGRRKYKESPDWANCLMARLVDENLVEVNERGCYRYMFENEAIFENISMGDTESVLQDISAPVSSPPSPEQPVLEGFFPTNDDGNVIGEDYFPTSTKPDPTEEETRWWVAPELLDIPKRAKGKKKE